MGAALLATDGIEGFLAISAKKPLCKTLIVFPQKLQAGSELFFADTITGKTHRIAPTRLLKGHARLTLPGLIEILIPESI